MNDSIEKLPKAVKEGTLTIFGYPIRVFILDNGQRVLEADSFKAWWENVMEGDVVITDDSAQEVAEQACRLMRGDLDNLTEIEIVN